MKENRQCTPCLCPCLSRKNSETLANTVKTMFVHSPFALISKAPSIQIIFLHLVHCSWLVRKHKWLKTRKPSLPLKFLNIWQARNISFRQDKKKSVFRLLFIGNARIICGIVSSRSFTGNNNKLIPQKCKASMPTYCSQATTIYYPQNILRSKMQMWYWACSFTLSLLYLVSY